MRIIKVPISQVCREIKCLNYVKYVEQYQTHIAEAKYTFIYIWSVEKKGMEVIALF